MSKKPLSRSSIVDAALAVADRDGLERVSMRTIATEIGAAPMALYRHVPSKTALLDFMLERVIERVFMTEVAGASWKEAVMASARQARGVLGTHPSWLPLLTRGVAPVSAIAIFERLAGSMTKDRIAPAAKLDAITSLMCFTLGFVLVERMMTPAEGEPIPLEQLRRARDSGLGGFPVMGKVAGRLEAWSFEAAFESGLRALVSEIDRRRAAS